MCEKCRRLCCSRGISNRRVRRVASRCQDRSYPVAPRDGFRFDFVRGALSISRASVASAGDALCMSRRNVTRRDILHGLLPMCKRTLASARARAVRRTCTFACKRGCIQTRPRCRSYFKPDAPLALSLRNRVICRGANNRLRFLHCHPRFSLSRSVKFPLHLPILPPPCLPRVKGDTLYRPPAVSLRIKSTPRVSV